MSMKGNPLKTLKSQCSRSSWERKGVLPATLLPVDGSVGRHLSCFSAVCEWTRARRLICRCTQVCREGRPLRARRLRVFVPRNTQIFRTQMCMWGAKRMPLGGLRLSQVAANERRETREPTQLCDWGACLSSPHRALCLLIGLAVPCSPPPCPCYAAQITPE